MLFPITVRRDVVPLGAEYYLDDDGFRSTLRSPGQQALSDIAPTTSLAVLGEPGIGKSQALRELTADRDADTVIRINLDTVADVRDLHDQLAAVDAAVANGMAPEGLTLVLDSIDECSIPPKSLIHHLAGALRQHHAPRVLLGCRTADWPKSLEAMLEALRPGLSVVELLPLGRADIAALAATRNVNDSAFLSAVVASGAVPLAALPLTLDLLLGTYEQFGRLPDSAAELYQKGLLQLVEEPDPERNWARRPAGSASQRLAVASKLAAYTMLCGRSAISQTAPAGDDELLAGDLAAGTEPIDGGGLTVTAELVDATLATALFTARGASRLTVVHASFGAYLTARYLTKHVAPEHQLRALLTRTNSLGRTRVPSRLRETAAWLVALEPIRNGWLVDVDPDTIAAHAALVNVATVRRTLVEYLLGAPEPYLRTGRRRWRLAHPGLAEQLRPALRAPLAEDAGPHFGHPVSRRARVAVEIARHSGGQDSVPDLVDLLLSSTTNSYLRGSAAYALTDLDAATAARTLRSVLKEVAVHPGHDPEDELRGLALKANWPQNLTANELVNALTHPQRSDFLGAYAFFLHGFLEDVDDLVITDLVRAVAPALGRAGDGEEENWVDETALPSGAPPPASVGLLTGGRRGARAMTALLARAVGSAHLDAMLDEVGCLLATAIQHHQDLAVAECFDDPRDPEDSAARRLRRALVLATLRHMPVDRAVLLPGRAQGLLTSVDLEWLLSLGETEFAAKATALIRFVFDATDLRQQELVWAHRGEPIFDDSVGHWFDPVDIDSQQAQRMREEYAWSLDTNPVWDGAVAHESALRAAWSLCERNGSEGFPALCGQLAVDPMTGAPTTNDDLTSWPSYSLLDVDETVLTTSAEQFLRDGDTGDDAWLDQPGGLSFLALVGYVALAYLARRPDGDARLDALPGRVWQRWTPTILRLMSRRDDDPETQATLKRKAQQHAPAVYKEWALRSIETDARAGWVLDPLNEAGDYDDTVGDRLDAVLRSVMEAVTRSIAALNRIAEPPHAPHEPRTPEGELRTALLVAGANATHIARFLTPRRELTVEWLRDLASGTTTAPVEVRVLAADVLLTTGELGWKELLGWMHVDESFGRALAVDVARQRSRAVDLPRLTDRQLAELWLWLDERWNSQEDTFANGFMSDDELVRDWRNGIIFELQVRATPDALAALAELVANRPENSRLQAALADAEARDHDENWHGVRVAELTELLADERRTVINDDDSLYRAVLTSLDRFAVQIRDNGQALWNETRPEQPSNAKTRVWTPKYEPDVSAALKAHLAQEFGERLVVNREVLVKQTTSKGQGLSVDVLPTATETEAGHRPPCCPIEVKGSWNRGLLTDLQDQLVNDYLPATGATRGVYVCAWFPIDQWDDLADSRHKAGTRRSREEVVKSLTDAARIASQPGDIEVTALVIEIPRPIPSSRARRVPSDANQSFSPPPAHDSAAAPAPDDSLAKDLSTERPRF